MACKYKVKGTEEWLNESDFKVRLSQGLLDNLMTNNNIKIKGFEPMSMKSQTATTKESALERGNNLINSMNDGDKISEQGVDIERVGDDYFVSYTTEDGGKVSKRKSNKTEALKTLSSKIAKSRAGKNIDLKEYKTEKVNGQDLKVGDIYSRVINGTRYVFKVLSKPYLPTKGMRALGDMNMDVEVLHVGNQVSEMPESSGTGALVENEYTKKVGDKTIDTFRTKSSGGLLLGKVDKINNWKEESAPRAVEQTAPSTEVVAKEEKAASSGNLNKYTPAKATVRGVNIDGYSVKLNEGGKTADVKMPSGKEAKNLKVNTLPSGAKYVVGPNGSTITIPSQVESTTKKSTKAETKTEAATEEKKIRRKPIAGIDNKSSKRAIEIAEKLKFSPNEFTGEESPKDVGLVDTIEVFDKATGRKEVKEKPMMAVIRDAVDKGDITSKEATILENALEEKKKAFFDAKAKAKPTSEPEDSSTKDRVKAKIDEIAESLKRQPGVLKTTLNPFDLIPDSVRNKIIDTAADLIKKGVDLMSAISEAIGSVMADEVISGRISKEDAEKITKEVKTTEQFKKEVEIKINDSGVGNQINNIKNRKQLYNDIISEASNLYSNGVEPSLAIKTAGDSILGEEIINGRMTIEEAQLFRAELLAAATPSELSGVKKEYVSKAAQDLFERTNAKLTQEEWINLGKKALEEGIIDAEALINDILDGRRNIDINPLNILEQTVLHNYAKQLDDKINDLMVKQSNEMKERGAESLSIKGELSILENKKINFGYVLAATNYHKGLSLSLNKAMIDDDYNIVRQIAIYETNATYNDNQIPDDVRAKLEELTKKINEYKAKLREIESEREKEIDKQIVESIKEDSKQSKKKKQEKDTELTISPDGKIKIPKEMIREIVQSGVSTIEELTSEVMKRLSKLNPKLKLTERQVRDAITGYGMVSSMNVDEVSDAIRSMKEVGKMISNLEEIELKQKEYQKALEASKKGDNSLLEKFSKKFGVKSPKAKMDVQEQRKLALRKMISDALNSLPMSVEEEAETEANRIEQYRKRQRRNLFLLNEKKKELNSNGGVFPKKIKAKELELNKEDKKILRQIQSIKSEIDKIQMENERKDRRWWTKLFDGLLEATRLGVSLVLSADISVMRQALPLMINMIAKSPSEVKKFIINAHKYAGLTPNVSPFKDPKQFIKDLFKNILIEDKGKQAYENMIADIKNSEEYELMKESGLYLMGTDQYPDDMFLSRWMKHMPIIGDSSVIKIRGKSIRIPGAGIYSRSERSFSSINELKIALFMNDAKKLMASGITFANSPETYKALARFHNSFSGRGEWNKATTFGRFMESAVRYLNIPFISTRFIKSRLDFAVLNPFAWGRFLMMPKEIRKLAGKRILGLQAYRAGLVGLFYILANMDDDDNIKFEIDPRGTKSLVLQVGNIGLDMNLGFGQVDRLASQLITSTRIVDGIEEKINDDDDFFGKSYGDLYTKFYLNKMSTVPRVATMHIFNMKQEETPIYEYFTPMTVTTTNDIFNEKETVNYFSGSAYSYGNFLGIVNASVYEDNFKTGRKRRSRARGGFGGGSFGGGSFGGNRFGGGSFGGGSFN